MNPTLRKPAGVLAIILGIALYALAVASMADWLGQLPVLVQLPAYVILGIIWILPLKPLLRWMETGKWRE